jgi:hypothetical protein
MADEKDLGFKVTDRRMFNPDGTPRQPAEEKDSGAAADNVVPFPGRAGQAKSKEPRLPQPSFAGLVNMLAVEAALHLGLIEPPKGIERHVDLEAARHLIDLLGILQEKTRGNLAPDEGALLDNVLAELRMQFVILQRKQ